MLLIVGFWVCCSVMVVCKMWSLCMRWGCCCCCVCGVCGCLRKLVWLRSMWLCWIWWRLVRGWWFLCVCGWRGRMWNWWIVLLRLFSRCWKLLNVIWWLVIVIFCCVLLWLILMIIGVFRWNIWCVFLVCLVWRLIFWCRRLSLCWCYWFSVKWVCGGVLMCGDNCLIYWWGELCCMECWCVCVLFDV